MRRSFLNTVRSEACALRETAFLSILAKEEPQEVEEATLEAFALGNQFAGSSWSLEPRGAADDVAGPVSPWSGRPYHSQVIMITDTVALLPVHGPIGKYLEPWEMYWYDACCLSVIDQQLENVAGDSRIETLVLSLRSPGGCSLGLEETAGRLLELEAAGVRTIAFADYEMCSAAYWLAAACTEIHTSIGAIVGSISTFIASFDTSQYFAMMGIELVLARSGQFKAMGLPGKPWTEEERQLLEERLRAFDRPFKETVADRRGVGPEVMQGQTWQGKEAPQGLVDSAGEARTLRELLALVI